MKNIQFGKSLIGDFEESTWTFKMPEDFTLSAGKFAIVPEEEYEKLLESNKS
ncbi:hypothetical protein [Zunongwangia profunda]|jgi:hypothetical protein|uniref:hypothetical protein n=1 Tax=Zunongwangia profunda TaxID=398743 RepID=UPI00248DF41B|nr:hypothetical protein [Zunongwangia profunda]|tara:strand:- start:2338 stop:2493 length:156 start_codon:yes stop_codon:yes gene_type:complete